MATDLMTALRRVQHEAVHALATAHDFRDSYTGKHQRDTADIAQAIAAELGLSAERTEGIYLAAVVHDIGKLAIPMEILSHPGKLTNRELRMVKIHPQVGHDITARISFPWPIPRIILEHHERLDGSGYPNGLVGDEILLDSRIVAVADVLEAMTADRPYRPAQSVDRAFELLKRGAGTLFDPDVVDACTHISFGTR